MIGRITSVVAIILLILIMGFVGYQLFQSHNDTHPLSLKPNQNKFHSASEQDYTPVATTHNVTLPAGFAFHSGYQHEWWTLAANVKTDAGHQYGIHWQFFRLAHDATSQTQLYLAQVTISDRSHHWYAQRIARSGSEQAGLQINPFDLWIDNWHLSSLDSLPLSGQLNVFTKQWGMQLALTPMSKIIMPGQGGVQSWGKTSANHPLGNAASLGWQAPIVGISGRLTLPNHRQPIHVSGKAWLAKRWGNHLLFEPQSGRDWFVFHFSSGMTLSVTRFRQAGQKPQFQGVLTDPSGNAVTLSSHDIIMTPTLMGVSGQSHYIPYQWNIRVPEYDIDLTATAINRTDWLPLLVPSWTGPINVSGSHTATGFMQLTGY
ncbi:MAG: lipocalin-like domain-containing protein [Vibrio sp.]